MRDKEFRSWLINDYGYNIKVASDIISRLRRIEKALTEYLGEDIDLDAEYQKDGYDRIKKMISFHEVNKLPGEVNLIRERFQISTLRHALRKYEMFFEAEK